VRVADLMQGWRVSNSEIPHEIGARWLIPPKDGAAQLSRALAAHSSLQFAIPEGSAGDRKGAALRRREPRACLGLFAAGEKLGFHFAHGAPLHLYLEDISCRVLEQFGLSAAGVGERVDVIVRRPRNAEAVSVRAWFEMVFPLPSSSSAGSTSRTTQPAGASTPSRSGAGCWHPVSNWGPES
jgi:hypothetical protein